MSAILAAERSLPPGLWLPTAEESTEQYRAEVFSARDRDYEDVIDLGLFAVALATFDTNRYLTGSLMPTYRDLLALYKEGYGIESNMLHRYYGGTAKLQVELGFYPNKYVPEKNELLERLEWLAGHAAHKERPEVVSTNSVNSLLVWGKSRNLIPSRGIVAKVMGNQFTNDAMRQVFGIDKPRVKDVYNTMDVYRFGAKVIRENDGPITQTELRRKYATEFEVMPYTVVTAFFDSLTDFWLEYGYVAETVRISKDKLRNIGIRHAISNDDPYFSKSKIEQLAAEGRFPSPSPIRYEFGGLENYKVEVKDGYEKFKTLQAGLAIDGVSKEVAVLACREFEPTIEFITKTYSQAEQLAYLSVQSADADYVRRIMQYGFDLESELTMQMQLHDFRRSLKRIGISTAAQEKYIFDLVPRAVYEILVKV